MSTAVQLKKKLKQEQGIIPEIHAIRVHRSISWLAASEEHEKNPDFKFISLWISLNSLYAINNNTFENKDERKRFNEFITQLVQFDETNRLYALLWNKYSGSIRLLIENQYVYEPFWEFQRGSKRDWKIGFEKSIKDANEALSKNNVEYLLSILLDRLYTLRNQMVHGGSTYNSKINRSQLKDAGNILQSLIPVLIEIMIFHPNHDWGNIYYPPIR